jgi:5'-3' exonuclease
MVENYIEKIRKQVVHISSEDMLAVSRLCKSMEIPFYTAKAEAESMCSWLCKTGQVDAVVTEDSDALAYGSPLWISELDFQGNCMRIQLEDVLREMEFTQEQFLDFCIMCGTDFNHRVEKLGPVTAYQLLKKHNDIETISKEKAITGEEWKAETVRRIFSQPCDTAIRSRENLEELKVKISYNKVPNEHKLISYLKKQRLPSRYAVEYFEQEAERIVFEY